MQSLISFKALCKNRAFRRICIIIAAILIICGLCLMSYKLFLDPQRGTITSAFLSAPLDKLIPKDKALDDLELMMSYLKQRHPACMKGIPQAVMTQYEQQKSTMPDEVTVLSLWRSAAAILAEMKDGHTSVQYITEDLSRLPLTFSMEKDGLYAEPYGTGEFYLVKEINGIDPEQLYKTFAGQFSYEQESYARYQFARRLSYKTYLAFMGLDVSDNVEIIFQDKVGTKVESCSFQIFEEEKDQKQPFVTFDIDEENSFGILRLRSCVYDDLYRSTLKDFFTEARKKNIRHVAVDLRGNGGGNSLVINEFLRYIDVDSYYSYGGVDVRIGPFLLHNRAEKEENKPYEELLFSGKVYALTLINTFSAALDFATVIQDNGIGQVIGEVPGGMPASYGDSLRFRLPNSDLLVNVSYKYFNRPNGEKSSMPLIPDHAADREDAEDRLRELIASLR